MSDGTDGSDGGSEDRPADTMRDRVPERGWWLWALVGADRWLVTALFLGIVFLGLVALGVAHPTPAAALLTAGDPVETLFQALVTSTITGVTLVLTLSQLVLSQELGAVGDQRERMTGAMQFRRDVEGMIDVDVSPAEPSTFLRALLGATRDRAEAFADAVDAEADYADRVDAYVDDVVGNADEVMAQLDGAHFGDFEVVWAALNYNYSWKIYAGRRLRSAHGDDLPSDAVDALDALVDALVLFGPAREHFKTLYFQWELSDLSRTLLYAAVPALVVAVAALLFLDPSGLPGATLGVGHALVVVALATTVAVLPFALLLSYILRIVTVTKRTLSIGPFILRETDRTDLDGD